MRIRIAPRPSPRKESIPARGFAFVLLLILLVLTCASIWALNSFDNITLAEIVFYLTMPLQGTSRTFLRQLFFFVALPSGLLFVLAVAAFFLPRRRQVQLTLKSGRVLTILPFRPRLKSVLPVMAAWLCVLLPLGNSLLDIGGYISSLIHHSPFIEEHYVDPRSVRLSFPEKKKNLITIYVESAESTNQDVAHGGMLAFNHIPEMTALAEEFTSFSQSDLLQGAAVAPACGWTIAGLVAQTAGIPLKLYGFSDNLATGADNMGNNLVQFLPGAWTLGDILKQEGYHTVFMVGSDFDFGGRRQFYARHGTYEVFDYFTAVAAGFIPEDYYTGWGFEDEKLYALAKEELLTLAAEDRPFHFGMLTVDTHHPGFPCRLCPDDGEADYGRVLRCSSRQLGAFIDWCREQSFWENTVIVITGDHASMDKTFYTQYAGEYDKYHGASNRLVYNCFIHAARAPAQEKNRRFTTLDFFPTVLSAMGVDIEGDQLGLGVDLFSGAPTLSETYGYDELFMQLNRKSRFYDRELLYP